MSSYSMYTNMSTNLQVRAFLDSQGLSYSVVEVDAVLRQSIKWSPYKKVPMLLAKCKDGRYIQLTESSMIVSILASVLADPSKDVAELYNFYPTETFVDESGSTRSEVLNKYFLMLDGQKVPKPAEKEAMELVRYYILIRSLIQILAHIASSETNANGGLGLTRIWCT